MVSRAAIGLRLTQSGRIVNLYWPKLLPFALGGIWCCVLGLLWNYEEPNKPTTVAVTLSVYAVGATLIYVAMRARIICDQHKWLVAFLIKLTLSFVICSYFWTAPLSRAGLLRVAQAVPGLQDANLYDYQAVMAAQHGLSRQYLQFTWQSLGVVGYLALIYRLAGVSVWYVAAFNALLSLLGTISLTGTLTTLNRVHLRRWQWLRFAMLIPFVAYYEATPGKEALTNAFFYLTMFFLVRLVLYRGTFVVNVVLALAALVPLTLVRANVAFLLLVPNIILLVRRARGWRSLVLPGLALGLVLGLVIITGNANNIGGSYFNPTRWFAEQSQHYASRVEVGDHPLKLAVANLLLPRTIADLILFLPIRTVIWLYLPYPLIFPAWSTLFELPELLSADPLRYFVLVADLHALASTWLLIMSTPFVIAGTIAKRSLRTLEFQVLVLNLLVPLLAISNITFIMGRRYRTLLEPLVLALALWGCSFGRPSKYQPVIYVLFGGGLLLFLLYSLG